MVKANRHNTLERLLQSQGFGARKLCRSLVRSGAVLVNGEVCEEPDEVFATEGLRFEVAGFDGVWPYCQHAYILLNKPIGYECSPGTQASPERFVPLAGPLARTRCPASGSLGCRYGRPALAHR